MKAEDMQFGADNTPLENIYHCNRCGVVMFFENADKWTRKKCENCGVKRDFVKIPVAGESDV